MPTDPPATAYLSKGRGASAALNAMHFYTCTTCGCCVIEIDDGFTDGCDRLTPPFHLLCIEHAERRHLRPSWPCVYDQHDQCSGHRDHHHDYSTDRGPCGCLCHGALEVEKTANEPTQMSFGVM